MGERRMWLFLWSLALLHALPYFLLVAVVALAVWSLL